MSIKYNFISLMNTSSNESDDENYREAGNDTTLFNATLPKINDTKMKIM